MSRDTIKNNFFHEDSITTRLWTEQDLCRTGLPQRCHRYQTYDIGVSILRRLLQQQLHNPQQSLIRASIAEHLTGD